MGIHPFHSLTFWPILMFCLSPAFAFVTPNRLGTIDIKAKCLVYAYDMEVSLTHPWVKPDKAKAKALGVASDICRQLVRMECLDFSYKILVGHREDWPLAYRKNQWNQAVNACRPDIDVDCLTYSMEHYQKDWSEKEAFQKAVRACKNLIYGECLRYADDTEKKLGATDDQAFENGLNICKGQTTGLCLRAVYENLLPEARPHVIGPWQETLKICRKF